MCTMCNCIRINWTRFSEIPSVTTVNAPTSMSLFHTVLVSPQVPHHQNRSNMPGIKITRFYHQLCKRTQASVSAASNNKVWPVPH